jgi:hypothetical protein
MEGNNYVQVCNVILILSLSTFHFFFFPLALPQDAQHARVALKAPDHLKFHFDSASETPGSEFLLLDNGDLRCWVPVGGAADVFVLATFPAATTLTSSASASSTSSSSAQSLQPGIPASVRRTASVASSASSSDGLSSYGDDRGGRSGAGAAGRPRYVAPNPKKKKKKKTKKKKKKN